MVVKDQHGSPPAWLWWVAGARATLAFILGIAVLLSGQGRPALANFIAGYWLAGALLTLRWALAPGRPRSTVGVAAAVLGGAAALLVLARSPLRHVVPEDVLLNVLGVAAVLTGILRLGGGLRDDRLVQEHPRLWRRGVLGLLEILLGVVLLVAHEASATISTVAGVWGLAGGTLLLLDALTMRRAAGRWRGI